MRGLFCKIFNILRGARNWMEIKKGPNGPFLLSTAKSIDAPLLLRENILIISISVILYPIC